MQINIEVIAVEVINKGKYKVAEVTSKQDGKTGTKKIMSFGAQAHTFGVFSSDKIKKGDCFTVEIEKNADGYWDWIKAVPAGSAPANDAPANNSKSTPAPRAGNYETPEEREARQEFIIRQSSLTNAIAYLNHTKKAYEPIEIIDLAESFIMFVYKKATFGSPINQSIDTSQDVPM